MKILCTFPGKFGDLLWALPAIRALAARNDGPIDLLLAAPLDSMTGLIRAQDYIHDCWADMTWRTQDTAPISPRQPAGVPAGYDQVYHLGYCGWPNRPLPFETLDCLNLEYTLPSRDGDYASAPTRIDDGELHLDRPWITFPARYRCHWDWNYGFTDEHFELKYGLVQLLERRRPGLHRDGSLPPSIVGENSRWVHEGVFAGQSWMTAAGQLAHTKVFLGCCSALHVLAVAMGIPTVLMEPNPLRHQPIFYPLGMDSPRVTLVRGNDGQPTFDARHVYDMLHLRLEQTR